MITDIDRLHKVALGKMTGRRCGKTFLRCHELAGLVELGHDPILCVISEWMSLAYIRPMLIRVMADHGIDFRRDRRMQYWAGKTKINFIPTYPSYKYNERISGYHGSMLSMRNCD